MIYRLSLILIFIASSCHAQHKAKPDLYLYFKPDSLIYKINQKRTEDIIRKGKVVSPKYDYDVYTWQYLSDYNIRRRFKLMTIDKSNYYLKDSVFVKKNAKTFEQIKNNSSIFYDSTDTKRFPFRKIFIAEYIATNQYKIVQVQTYMGSDQ